MTPVFQVFIILIGAVLAGINAGILWILSDLRKGLLRLDTRLNSHIENRTIHK